MRSTSIAGLITLTALLGIPLAAADTVGIFKFSRRMYDPANPLPSAVARDGTIESAVLASSDTATGRVNIREWSGDNQAGGRGVGGVNLALPPGTNAYLGLVKDWAIEETAQTGGVRIYTIPRSNRTR